MELGFIVRIVYIGVKIRDFIDIYMYVLYAVNHLYVQYNDILGFSIGNFVIHTCA